jgi:hypothetical protein
VLLWPTTAKLQSRSDQRDFVTLTTSFTFNPQQDIHYTEFRVRDRLRPSEIQGRCP